LTRLVRDALALIVSKSTACRRWIFGALALGLIIAASGALIIAATDAPMEVLLKDPNSLALPPNPWYFGFIELASGLILVSCGASTIFAATLARREWKAFLYSGGMVTIVLGLDDVYMLHETISERSLYLMYGIVVPVFMAVNKRAVLASPFPLLLLSIAMLAASVVVDTANDWEYLHVPDAEEFVELFGFCFWYGYFIATSRLAIQPVHSAGPRRE
jgi:hypothetical protein